MKCIYTFIVDDTSRGFLIPLSTLVSRMHLVGVTHWRFREVTIYGRRHPFGMTFNEFEEASRAAPRGFEVTVRDFRSFLESDVQVIDGVVEALSDHSTDAVLVRLDCEDASQWEITTDQPELARTLHRLGYKEIEGPENRHRDAGDNLSG